MGGGRTEFCQSFCIHGNCQYCVCDVTGGVDSSGGVEPGSPNLDMTAVKAALACGYTLPQIQHAIVTFFCQTSESGHTVTGPCVYCCQSVRVLPCVSCCLCTLLPVSPCVSCCQSGPVYLVASQALCTLLPVSPCAAVVSWALCILLPVRPCVPCCQSGPVYFVASQSVCCCSC